MKEKMILLGTGHAMTLDCFNTCFVIDTEGGECVLVDTGGGLQILRQLRDAGVDYMRIHDIFVSHQHTDHLLGLFWILRAMGRIVENPDYGRPLTIYMHRELEAIARQAIKLIMPEKQCAQLDKRIILRPVDDGEEGSLGGHPVKFFDTHSVSERQYGFKMTLFNGKTLFFNGDVPIAQENYPLAQDSDWLLCDAFNLASKSRRFNPGHSTVLSAAQTAAKLNAGNLVLYHGPDDDLAGRKATFTAEAATAYSGPIYVPMDLEEIEL